MEARETLFEMCEDNGGNDVGIEGGGAVQLTDTHIINDVKDEGGAMDACAVEGVIFNADLPDSLEFSSLVFSVLRDGEIVADALCCGKRLSVLCRVGGLWVNDAPEVVLGMGLVVYCLEE